MGDLLIDNQTTPTTPASGKGDLFIDATTKKLALLDDAGYYSGAPLSRNAAIASQGAGFATDTYVTNSGLLIPSFGMKVGQIYRWVISVSKTAAGTATPIYTIRIGSAQSVADTARLALTGAAATAAVSAGLVMVQAVVRVVSATGVIAGGVGVMTNSPGLGGGQEGAGAAFDNSALGGQYVGLSINGGTAAAWTISSVSAELIG